MVRPFLSLILAVPLLAGCGAANSGSTSASASGARPMDAHTTNEQQFHDIKSKMATMTPDQRAQYIREHPEEFANLGNAQVPTPSPTSP